MDRLGQPFDDPAAQAFQQGSGDCPTDHHGVFVTAQAVDASFAIADLLEDFRALPEGGIADEMPVMIVGQLEAVEVDHRQRDFVPLADFILNIAVQRPPVGQLGEAVTSCKLIDNAQLAKTETGAERCRCSKQNGADPKYGIGRSEAVKPVGNRNRPSQDEYGG